MYQPPENHKDQAINMKNLITTYSSRSIKYKNEHSASELKLTIQKIHTFFYSTEQFFQNSNGNNLKFIYDYHRKALQFFTKIFYTLLDQLEQHQQLNPTQKNKKERKFEQVTQSAQKTNGGLKKPIKIFQNKLSTQQSNKQQAVLGQKLQRPSKKVKANKMGGIYLFNQDYKRNLQILPKLSHPNYFNSQLFFKQKKEQFIAEIKKQIQEVQTREQEQTRYERQQIDLFMREHRPLVNNIRKMLCAQQLSDLQSAFKDSHQSALQFLKSSKIDYLGKAQSIGNFNNLYLDFQYSKKNHIENINTKISELFQIIKAKEKQLQQACIIQKQKIRQLNEKINKKTRAVDTQTQHDFKAEMVNIKSEYQKLQTKYKDLQNQTRTQAGINLSDFTKERQLLEQLNDKKFIIKNLQKTIAQQNQNIEKIKKEVGRLRATSKKSKGKKSQKMNQQSQIGLVTELIQYFQNRGVIRKQSVDLNVLKRESNNILKAFQKQYFDLSFPSNNKIEPYIPSHKQISQQQQIAQDKNLYKKKKFKKTPKLERLEKSEKSEKLLRPMEKAIKKQKSQQMKISFKKAEQKQSNANSTSIKMIQSKKMKRSFFEKSKTSLHRRQESGTQKSLQLKQTQSYNIIDAENKQNSDAKVLRQQQICLIDRNIPQESQNKYFTPLKAGQNKNPMNNIRNSNAKGIQDTYSSNNKEQILRQVIGQNFKRMNKSLHEKLADKKQSICETNFYDGPQSINEEPVQKCRLEQQNPRIHSNLGNPSPKIYRAKNSYIGTQELKNNLAGDNWHLGVKRILKKLTFQDKHLAFDLQNQQEKRQQPQQSFFLTKKIKRNQNIESKDESQDKSNRKQQFQDNNDNEPKQKEFQLKMFRNNGATNQKSQVSLQSQKQKLSEYSQKSTYEILDRKYTAHHQKTQSKFKPYRNYQSSKRVNPPIHRGNIDANQIQAIKIAIVCKNKQDFRRKMIIIHMQRCGKYCNHLKRFCENFQKYRATNPRRTAPVHIKNLHEDSNLIQDEL